MKLKQYLIIVQDFNGCEYHIVDVLTDRKKAQRLLPIRKYNHPGRAVILLSYEAKILNLSESGEFTLKLYPYNCAITKRTPKKKERKDVTK